VSEGEKVVAVKRYGTHPVIVEFSDGSKSAYFCGDVESCKRAIESEGYPHDRTFHGYPPEIGDVLDAG
jgi:hypothetical protein